MRTVIPEHLMLSRLAQSEQMREFFIQMWLQNPALAKQGGSMEEEVRQILRRAVSAKGRARPKLGSRIAARFTDVGLTEPLPEMHGQTIAPMVLGA